MPRLSDLVKKSSGATIGETAPAVSPNPFETAFRKANIPTAEEFRGRSTLEKVLDYTARPQRALVGAIKGVYKDDLSVGEGIRRGLSGESQEGFKSILEDAGATKNSGLARYGGMVLDAVVDPLNAIPVGKLASAVSKAGKGAIGSTKIGAKALELGAEGAKKVTHSGFVRGIDAFAGMDPEMKKALRLAQAESRTTAERVISRLLETPSKSGKAGSSALEDLTSEELQKLVGRAKHEQTRAAIDKFAKTITPGKYKADEMVRFGDVEGFGPVKAMKEEPLRARLSDLKKGRSAGLADSLTPMRKDAVRGHYDAKIFSTEQALKVAQEGEANLQLPKDFINNLIQDTHSKQLPSVLRRYDSAWKKMATVWNPRFHVNNFLGNMWNMGIGRDRGATLTDNPLTAFAKGRDFLKRLDEGTLTAKELEIHEALRRYGVDTGLTSHINYDPNDINKVIESAKRVSDKGPLFQKGNMKGFMKRLDTKVGKAGDRSERAAKIGTVLQEMEKGGKSLEDAVLHAKDTLFDYQELTPEMRAIRNYIAPFWTFKLKNTPLQIKGVAKHPAWFAQLGKAKQNLDNAAKEDQTFVPNNERYEDDVFNGMMSLPAEVLGAKVGLRNPLPVADMNVLEAFNTDTRAGQNALEQQADSIHPFWQTLMKTAFNVDIRRPGMSPKPPEGLLGMVPGSPAAQMLPDSLNPYQNRSNKNATELRVPFIVNEILNQVPLANTAGRIAMPLTNPDLGTDPLAALSWFGVPAVGTTPESRKKAKASNRRTYSTLKNKLRRDAKEKR